MEIKVYDLVERLIEAYKKGCEIELCWSFEEKQIIEKIDSDETCLKKGALYLCLATYKKSDLNEEILTPEEIPLYLEYLKAKDFNDGSIEDFLNVSVDSQEDLIFFNRLKKFFEKNNLNKIFKNKTEISDLELEEIGNKYKYQPTRLGGRL